MSLIRTENLSFQYIGSPTKTLDSVNLSIDSGEFILLIGPTGCGKTSLCRCFNGLIPHFYHGKLSGRVFVNGLTTHEGEVYDLATTVGLVFQNPENQLVSLNVERELAFAPENLGLTREEISDRVEEVISLLNLESIRKKPPFELSGGEQQRVAIGSVLTMRPRVLVLDEPTANLDPKHALEILQLLIDLHNEKDLAIVLVEHRLDQVIQYASRVVVMNHGQLILDTSPRAAFQNPVIDDLGIAIPRITRLFSMLRKNGYHIKDLPINQRNALEIVFPKEVFE